MSNMEDLLTAPKRHAGSSPPAKTAKPKAKPTRKQTTVIPKGYKCNVPDRRTKQVFEELRHLKVEDFPNAAAVMLRILLELAVDRYMHKTGLLDLLVQKFRDKDPNKKKDWSPSLDQMLNDLVTTPNFKQHPAALKLLNKMIREQHPQLRGCRKISVIISPAERSPAAWERASSSIPHEIASFGCSVARSPRR